MLPRSSVGGGVMQMAQLQLARIGVTDSESGESMAGDEMTGVGELEAETGARLTERSRLS